jgi:hypothetical protein
LPPAAVVDPEQQHSSTKTGSSTTNVSTTQVQCSQPTLTHTSPPLVAAQLTDDEPPLHLDCSMPELAYIPAPPHPQEVQPPRAHMPETSPAAQALGSAGSRWI